MSYLRRKFISKQQVQAFNARRHAEYETVGAMMQAVKTRAERAGIRTRRLAVAEAAKRLRERATAPRIH